MCRKFETDEKVYYIECGRTVKEASILASYGEFIAIRLETGGAICLRDSKIYVTPEDAKKHLKSAGHDREMRRRFYWH